MLQTPRTCPHKVQPLSPSRYSPKQPNKLLQTLGCTCAAFQCLSRGTSPLGNTGICAGPAIPIKPGFVLTETSQTKQKASRSPNTRAILHFTRSFAQHSCLFPHLITSGHVGRTPGPCPNPHRGMWQFRLWLAQAPGTRCRAAASRQSIPQQHTEPPMKPQEQFKDQRSSFSGLKLSH